MHELHKFNFMTTSTLLRNINPESENIHLPHVQNPLRLDFADFPEFREFIRKGVTTNSQQTYVFGEDVTWIFNGKGA